jgi:hypothetical protein
MGALVLTRRTEIRKQAVNLVIRPRRPASKNSSRTKLASFANNLRENLVDSLEGLLL